MSEEPKHTTYTVRFSEFEIRYIANRLLELSEMDHTTEQERADLEYWAHNMLYATQQDHE